MTQATNLVIISFYDRRPVAPLAALLQSLRQHPAGAEYDVLLVVNSTGDWRVPEHLLLPGMRVHYRDNAGMNIGAWDGGWKHAPDYSRYLFLQDECIAQCPGWMAAFANGLDDSAVGLLGESYNGNWNQPWDKLRAGPGVTVMPGHDLQGKPANRVDVYLDFMQRHGIDPGATGGHLRSLAWALRGDTLRRLGGFPEGASYGECIAAEIGVSKAVEALGLRVAQVAERPFAFFRHVEWNQKEPGGPFTHARVSRPVSHGDYRARMATYRPWIASIPFEHGLRKRGPDMAHERWLAEADAYAALAQENPPQGVALLLDPRSSDIEAYLGTLASWHLQSWPNVGWIAWAPEPADKMAVRVAKGLPAPLATLATVDGLALAALGVDWLVPAHAGDFLHPSLAGQVALAGAEGAEAVAWDFLRHQRGATTMRSVTRHRGPGIDPVLDLVRDTRGRAYALPTARVAGARVATGDAWSLRLHAAATIGRWRVLSEPLASYPADTTPTAAPANRELADACAQALLGTGLDWSGIVPVPATAARSVSVVLLFRDRPELTLAAIESVLRQQLPGTLELVLVDNQSRTDTVSAIKSRLASLDTSVRTHWLSYDQAFNHSRQCQLGAQAATGDVLVFLNNDACLLDDFALDHLSRWARLPGIASVGARIVDGDGATSGGGFLARRLPGAEFNSPVEEAKGSFAELTRCTIGNTFACAAVSADAFRRIGLDPVRFPIGFNDVDYCLRASRDGWRHVNVAEVRVLHAVGASRARIDEIAQKLTIRCEHPWLFNRALQELDAETLPAALAIDYPRVALPTPADLPLEAPK